MQHPFTYLKRRSYPCELESGKQRINHLPPSSLKIACHHIDRLRKSRRSFSAHFYKVATGTDGIGVTEVTRPTENT